MSLWPQLLVSMTRMIQDKIQAMPPPPNKQTKNKKSKQNKKPLAIFSCNVLLFKAIKKKVLSVSSRRREGREKGVATKSLIFTKMGKDQKHE